MQVAGRALCAVPVAVCANADAQSGSGQVQVTGVRFHEDRGRMKMHIDLDRLPESHNVFTLENPHRIVIDLPSSRVSTLLSKELKARGTAVSYTHLTLPTIRLV